MVNFEDLGTEIFSLFFLFDVQIFVYLTFFAISVVEDLTVCDGMGWMSALQLEIEDDEKPNCNSTIISFDQIYPGFLAMAIR